METIQFEASTQYGDMQGSSCADEQDRHGIREYLDENKLLKVNGPIVGISIWSGRKPEKWEQENKIVVNFYIADEKSFDDVQKKVNSGEKLNVHLIRKEMSPNEFLGMFKRFSIYMSRHGVIDKAEINVLDSPEAE